MVAQVVAEQVQDNFVEIVIEDADGSRGTTSLDAMFISVIGPLSILGKDEPGFN